MRIFTALQTCLLILFLHVQVFAQDKVYFTSGDKDGKTESINQSTLIYTPPGKKPSPVTVTTKKLSLLFNKSGDFLAFERLDFSNVQTQEAITRFLTGTVTREKDQVYVLTGARIDDKIITEDKDFIYLQTNAEKINKKTVAAVIYKDGHHTLYAPAPKAAIVLWENKPTAAAPSFAGGSDTKTTPKKDPPVTSAPAQKTPPPAAPKKDTPITVSQAPVTRPVTQDPPSTATAEHPLSFEEVAGNVSKAEFEKKALQKTNQLNIYLKVICDKNANYEEINKAIDQSVGLFVDENAMIETSSVNRNDIKRYKIRSYLSHIKLVNYDKIEIEWTNVQYVSDVKQGPDGNYYGVVSFEQVFRGYRDGNLIYKDITRKNTTVVLKTYEKNINGNIRNVWDVLLSDIGVISTQSL